MNDKNLNCIDCQDDFVWTTGEQAFMNHLKEQGKIDEVRQPRRCKRCRDIRKNK